MMPVTSANDQEVTRARSSYLYHDNPIHAGTEHWLCLAFVKEWHYDSDNTD